MCILWNIFLKLIVYNSFFFLLLWTRPATSWNVFLATPRSIVTTTSPTTPRIKTHESYQGRRNILIWIYQHKVTDKHLTVIFYILFSTKKLTSPWQETLIFEESFFFIYVRMYVLLLTWVFLINSDVSMTMTYLVKHVSNSRIME